MALNFPGPYDIRIKYLPVVSGGAAIEHEQKLNVSLVEPAVQNDVFGNHNINDIDGATTVDLASVVEDYLAKLMALFHTTTNIVSVELWKYPVAQSSQSTFWGSYTPTVAAGTAGGATVPAGQDIFVFRTEEGNVMKLSPMEGTSSPGVPIAYASLDTPRTALVDYILDGDGLTYSAPFVGRDTSFPKSFIKEYPGSNEHLWKQRNGR